MISRKIVFQMHKLKISDQPFHVTGLFPKCKSIPPISIRKPEL